MQLDPDSVLNELKIEKAGKRPQLTNKQKDQFADKIRDIAGLDPSWIDIRTLSDDKQTARSISESNGAVKNSAIPIRDRVFVMRCTGSETTYEKIARYMDNNVARAGGIALLVGQSPAWSVRRLYYVKEKETSARKLAAFFAVPEDGIREITLVSTGTAAPMAESPLERSAVYISPSLAAEITKELERKKCVILQGPPGTGKTTLALQIGKNFVGTTGKISSVQFHAGFSYDDFIQGWRPNEKGFSLCQGHFLDICEEAADNPNRRYLLIIDEINRGNVSAIFGEFFSLIEATKRGPEFGLHLAYSQPDVEREEFYVPPNLFIIGTMNTADRSLAIVDYALRRRFSFIDLVPAFHDDEFRNFLSKPPLSRIEVDFIAERIISLNQEITMDTRNLGAGFEVGHSYFCTPPQNGQTFRDWYSSIIAHEISPLLREYWYDDQDRVQQHIALLMIGLSDATVESTGIE